MMDLHGLKVIVIPSKKLPKSYGTRYIVIDAETGITLDDAQGYGYKTKRNAYAAYAYKYAHLGVDDGERAKKARILAWLRKNKGFVEALEYYEKEVLKRSWNPMAKVDAKYIQGLLDEYEADADITGWEVLQIWRNR